MVKKSVLDGKRVLAVDDEPDVLDTVEELLDMCVLDKAANFDTALNFLYSNTYDLVILDIQGVDGIELLKHSVARGFPTVMLTAHAATPEALKHSITLGASAFLPKEYISNLQEILEDVMLGKPQTLWWLHSMKFVTNYFDKKYGSDWKEKDEFFKNFMESLKKEND